MRALSGTAQKSNSRRNHSDQARGGWEHSDGYHCDENFWEKVSEEFIIDPKTTYMNIGSTSSMPRHVLNSYNNNNQIVASNL
ncbi:MAG: hypothetical protein ACJAYB_000184 [Psychromonas sp.]